MAEQLGPMVRLWGLHPSQLPPSTATPEQLSPFLESILQESIPFIQDIQSTWKSNGSKSFPHSKSPVELFNRDIPVSDLERIAKDSDLPQLKGTKIQSETWALRRSVHEDATTAGTACWDEWVKHFKEEHAQSEVAFTPSVLSTSIKQEWDCSGLELEIGGETWTDLTLKREESVHKLPAPLNKRLFPVVQVTAAAGKGRREFIVVQIVAVDDATIKEKDNQDTVRGAYSSVERLRETPDGIEWIMATASDAKGNLPIWIQRPAVPGQIAKDVDMFLEWVAKERKGQDTGALSDSK